MIALLSSHYKVPKYGKVLAVLSLTSLCLLVGCDNRTPRQRLEAESLARNPFGRVGPMAASQSFQAAVKTLYAEKKGLLGTTRYRVEGTNEQRLMAGQASVRYLEFAFGTNGDLTDAREKSDQLEYKGDAWKVVSTRQITPKDPTSASTLLPAPLTFTAFHYANAAKVEAAVGKPQHKKNNGGEFGEWRQYRKQGAEQLRVNYVKGRAVIFTAEVRCGATRPERTPEQVLQAFGVNLPLKGTPDQMRSELPAAPVLHCAVRLFYKDGAPYYRVEYYLKGAHFS